VVFGFAAAFLDDESKPSAVAIVKCSGEVKMVKTRASKTSRMAGRCVQGTKAH
jgi:hypothetical protein